MKKLLTIVGLALIIGVVYINSGANAIPSSPTDDKTASSSRVSGEVVFVADGDTIRVKITETDIPTKVPNGTTTSVRLLGIDAPEINWEKNTSGCFGVPARNYLKNLLQGETVRLVIDKSQPFRDPYGRLLAYVYKNNKNVNQQLLANGYARELTAGSVYKLRKTFIKAANQARNNGRGLWKMCR